MVSLDDVLITDDLARRSSRPPDYAQEAQALGALLDAIAAYPRDVLQTLVELVIDVCHADSAGVSVLEPGGDTGLFRWHAIAGAFAANVGGTLPHDASPCGTVLELDEVLLFNEPERFFPGLSAVKPHVYESLLAPWRLDGSPIGTLWAIKHTPESRFDAEDARLLERLSHVAAAAWQTVTMFDEAESRQREAEMRLAERHSTEQALRESEERLRAIVEEVTNYAIFTTDIENQVVDWFPGAEAVFGWTAEEIVGQLAGITFTLEDRAAEQPRNEFDEARETGAAADVRWHVRKDKSRVFIDGVSRARHGADGQFSGLLKVGQDATERRLADQALRESEARYRGLFDSMDQGFCVVEVLFDADDRPLDYRFIQANPAFERHTGLREVVARTARELVPELEEHWFQRYGAVALTGEPASFVDEAQPMGGRAFEVFAFRLGDPELRHVAILFTDITQRRQAERDQAWLAAIVESSWDAIVGRTVDGTITTWNPGAEALYGYTAQEIVGQPISRLLPSNKPAELEAITARISRGERIPPFNTVRIHKDGSSIEVEMTVSPIRHRSGQILGVAAVARDARERRAAEQLQQEFLEAVSHDLRNPLAAIHSQVQLLSRRARKGTVDQTALTVALDGMESATRRMDAQLGELQDIARLRAGHALELRTGLVDLAELTRQAVTEATLSAPSRTIRVESPERGPLGQWDPLRLRRVLDNLLSNALKYSRREEIVVTVSSVERGDTQCAALSVRDQGVGIPKADIPALFERYRRGSNVARTTQGMGIGLVGARRIIEQHGGVMEVESEEGKGSTFTVVLPLLRPGGTEADR